MRVESIHCPVTSLKRFRGKGAKRRRNSSAQACDYIMRRGRYTAAKLAKARHKSEKEEGLVASGHLYMPSWGLKGDSPRPFFEAADEYERVNAKLCTKIEAAIPRDIAAAGLAEELIERFATRKLKGHPMAWAMHCTTAKDGGPNPHVHFQFTERLIVGEAPPPEIFFLRPEVGGCKKDRCMNAKSFVTEIRRAWADCGNELLIEIGSDVRLDPRSNAARGIKKLPGYHINSAARAIAARDEEDRKLGKKRPPHQLTPPASFERWAAKREKLEPLQAELLKLNQQKERDVKTEIANRNRERAATLRIAATEQTELARIRITRDRERPELLSDEEAASIRSGIVKTLAGWNIKWRRTGSGEMPAFKAYLGPRQMSFDGREIIGPDESEDTLARMIQVAQVTGKHRVEIGGSPRARWRLTELCAATGIEVVEPAKRANETAKGVAPDPGQSPESTPVSKPAAIPAPTPFDVTPSPFNF